MAEGDPTERSLAIDLEPHRAVLAVLDPQGIADVRRVERLDPDEVPTRLLAAIRILTERSPVPPTRLDLAMASAWLPERDGHDGRRIAQLLARETGLPTTVHPRGTCQAWAEATLGGAKGIEGFVFLALGDRLDGGVVLDGRPWPRRLDLAHLRVDALGRLCPCGKRGCLQRYASTDALDARAATLQVPRNQPAQAVPSAGLHDELGWRAAAGEGQALVLLQEAAQAVAIALVGLLHALDLEAVVLATPARTPPTTLLPLLSQALEGQMGRQVRVVPALLGREAALLGAGLRS